MVPLEKEVLAQFVEVYDRIIKIEKDHVKTIQELEKEHIKTIQELEKKHEDKDEENKKEIDSLKYKVNALENFTEKLGVEESCQMFGKVGFTQSGVYPIDPDGKSQNQPPIKATCRLPDGQTTIGEYLL